MATDESRTIVIVGQGGIQTDLELDTLADAEVADAIPDLLVDYSAECKDWTLIAREHWRCGRWGRAEELLVRGTKFFGGSGRHVDHMALINLHAMLAHLHLALARLAPKTIVPHAKYDVFKPGTRTKDYHYTETTHHINIIEDALRASGTAPEDEPVTVTMGKIILNLARGEPDVANKTVDRLLQRQPNNLAALTAQARLQFARRQHTDALATYQTMLQLNPSMQPDPRIGLGLCAYILGDKSRARAAWERAIQLNPESWAPILLIGLASLNTAREPQQSAKKRLEAETEGVSYVQRAFKLNTRSTAAALALTTVATLGGKIELASKLAERAVQYADNKRHSILANSERGRLGFIAGDTADVSPYFSAAKDQDPNGVNMIAELTLAQIAIKNGSLRDALNFVEQTAKRLGGKGPLEFTVLQASLLAYPHVGMPPEEMAKNLQSARAMLSDIQKQYSAATTEEDWVKLRGIALDADVFAELAKLWQEESIEKAITSYQTAISIKSEVDGGEDESKPVDYGAVRLSTNLASLYAMQGDVEAAENMFQDSIQRMGPENGTEADMLKTVIAYDLGRANEKSGDSIKATQWYRDVLRQHPEHMESKVRLATIAGAAGRNADAHNYLKECLRADETNMTLRSAYTNFLINIGSYKEALAFTSQTLKYDRKDSFTFTALGWLHFTLGREAKTTLELAERSKQYLRSAEAYERALSIDPKNAVAAQGLAIALVEDTLTPKALQRQQGSAEDVKVRTRLAGQALMIMGRIKDSLPEGAVNVNIGHCYFMRGEEERAIEAYGASLNAYGPRKVNVLLYLCRAWYSYANKESNFSAMGQALSYAQRAMHIQPSDRAILYNIAMIQQKGAEIMLALDPSRRTLDELQTALKNAQESVNTFRALADDKSGPLPYDAEIANQRSRYGENLLQNQGPKQIALQEAFEGDTAARVEEARKARAEEQARIEAAAAEQQAKNNQRIAELAEERRKAREDAQKWQAEMEQQREQDEVRKAQKKRKKDASDIVNDEDEEGDEERPRRKKKGSKKRKTKNPDSDEEMDEDAEEGEDADPEAARRNTLAKLKNKRKKATRADPDEGEANRRGKPFKSKAYIVDSDEEAEDVPMDDASDAGDAANGEADAAEPKDEAKSEGEGGGEDEEEGGETTAAPSPGAGDESD